MLILSFASIGTPTLYTDIHRVNAVHNNCYFNTYCTSSKPKPTDLRRGSCMDEDYSLKEEIYGHHVYKSTWTPVIAQILDVQEESTNSHDFPHFTTGVFQLHTIVAMQSVTSQLSGGAKCGYLYA